MKLSLEQFRERLVDYLYGTLEGEELRMFEECLAESEVCRRELSTMQSTLRTARLELAKPASGPAPVVRDAVLAAAAVEARALAAAARERKSQRPSLRPAAPSAARSDRWAWLRAPWLLPTLGVAAAAARHSQRALGGQRGRATARARGGADSRRGRRQEHAASTPGR